VSRVRERGRLGNPRERDQLLEDKGVDGWIILIWIFPKYKDKRINLAQDSRKCCVYFKYGNEHSEYMKCGGFLD
jgi:hypothetical protein